jgi:ABC-type multidrug transport system ATPase subunit/ABC-type multidrug transport system permease subunit
MLSDHNTIPPTRMHINDPDIEASIGGSSFSSKFASSIQKRDGFRVGFHNMTMTLKRKNQPDKIILNNVSGNVKKGRLTALMGPSGSGKTSLLNVLAARVTKTKGLSLTGELTVNGHPIESYSWFHRQVAFVEQDDLLFATLTVRETIELAARLRLPHTLSEVERNQQIEDVIAELGLKKSANTRIGNARIRGISGGERKRVSIALEILQSPSVLMLDEATSGLDSFQALRVMSTLKDLALAGRTVVTSIHQPRSSIYALFDDIVLLSEGSLIYCGPTSDLLSHLEQVGGHHLPLNYNPADFILDLVAIDVRSETLEKLSRSRIENLHKNAFTNASTNGNEHVEEDSTNNEPLIRQSLNIKGTRKYEASFITQFLLLTQRGLRQRIRDPLLIILPFGITLFFALVLGFVYFRTGQNLTQKAIQDKNGLMFFMILNQMMSGLFGQIGTFSHERDIVNRERKNKTYGVLPYWLSKFFVDLPSIIYPFIFTTVIWWLALLRDDAIHWLNMCLIIILGYIAASSFGIMFAALVGSAAAAQGIAMPFVLLFVLFSGFYANTELISPVLSWIQYISPMRWLFAASAVNEFSGMIFECDLGSKQGCIPSGDAFLERLGFSNDTIARSAGIMIGLIATYQLLGYLILRFKTASFITAKKVQII